MANISSAESLSRYIFSEKYYSKSDNRVRFNAFMPRENEVKISVFRIDGLGSQEIWDIGKEVAKNRNPSLKGRADLLVEHVSQAKLSVESDEPPQRHANIVFPSKDKSEQKLIAIKLAGSANLRLI
mgnify:CR=1 FL=1